MYVELIFNFILRTIDQITFNYFRANIKKLMIIIRMYVHTLLKILIFTNCYSMFCNSNSN